MKTLSALLVLASFTGNFAFAPVERPHNLWGLSQSRSDSPLFANIIIAGAPASGKGTQCEVIKSDLGVVHLSTGDMLRAAVAAGTEVGKKAKDFMDSGKLVPDEVIIGVVSTKVEAMQLLVEPC